MSMKNKHLEHPEDSIFTSGRKGLHNILNFLEGKNSKVSVKYDGAPAIVWGVNPDNNRFFVGTKSVFNKVLCWNKECFQQSSSQDQLQS